jgi:phage-related protein
MYLKNDRIIVTIKGTTFRSSKAGTGGQYVLDPTALTGWDDGASSRRNATVRPVSSGDFTEPYTFAARLITISGTAVANSRQELQQMRDKFTGLLVEDEYTEVSVETTAGVRYATVGLEGNPEWVQQLDTVAVFRIQLYSPDPYIYGYERTIHLNSTIDAGGGLTYPLSYPLNYNAANVASPDMVMTNRGNVAAWPKFVVTGDYYSGFTITNGIDKKLTFTGPVSTQSPVTVDTAKGTVMQNGTDKSYLLTDRDWFSVRPNESLTPEFIPIQNASGWCDIIIRDTFI